MVRVLLALDEIETRAFYAAPNLEPRTLNPEPEPEPEPGTLNRNPEP
jgi:hypothetical protein